MSCVVGFIFQILSPAKDQMCLIVFFFFMIQETKAFNRLTFLFHDSHARLKGIVHPKMKILSSFTYPQVVPNLYEYLYSAEHKGRYSEECEKQSSSGAPFTSIVFFVPTMEVNGAPKQPGYKLFSEYLPLCSAEQRNSYRFGTT